MQPNIKNRTIYCHDNLDVLKGMNSESIDLIYLDPPFNKNKVFTAPIGSSAEGASFKDFFREEDVKNEWLQDIREDFSPIHDFLMNIRGLSNLIDDRKSKHYLYNYCYLTYMARRLIEMQRILKPTGSLYLHCDPTMSHYLKILLDIIFGEKNFRNEIVWYKGYRGTSRKNRWQQEHDTIFMFCGSKDYYWGEPIAEYKDKKMARYNKTDDEGRRYALIKRRRTDGTIYYGKTYPQGKRSGDVIEIPTIASTDSERTGYPTQKPLALLERIIKASSPEGGLVLDPFCGCATTCVAAEKLRRKWMGIDVSVKAYELVKVRLAKEVKGEEDHLLNWEKEIHYTTTPPKRTDQGEDYREKKYVYVISHPLYRGYKIGIAKDVNLRLNAYQTSDPDRQYKLEFSTLTSSFREVERMTHERFCAKGEWTTTGKLGDIIDYIKGIA